MLSTYGFLLDFIFICVLIIIAAVLKAKISILRKWIIPTAMLAGFLGMFLGPEFLNVIPLNLDRLGNLVYHLMGIGFIAMSLKERDTTNNPGVVNSGLIIVSTYVIQAIVGLGIMMILVATFYPNLFQGIGLLLPLGFGQGPGQAYSIGSSWESLGVRDGGNLGLAVAGLGFVWATFIGIILMNILNRKKEYAINNEHDLQDDGSSVAIQTEKKEGILADAIDKITYQIAMIGVIYLITYFTLFLIDKYLTPLGGTFETLASVLIGFHFIIGSLYAMLFKAIIKKIDNRGWKLEHSPDNYLLSRISGASFDFMITASIAAISIAALKEYAVPILVFTTVGGIVTILFMLWILPRCFPQDKLSNILGFYGMLTGTISTGLALIKGVDPKFKTNAADNLVVGSASAILFGFPMLLVLNIPIDGYRQNRPELYWITLGIFVVYLALLISALLFRTRASKNK